MSATSTELIRVIEGSIVQGQELHLFLDQLSKQAKAIEVKDQSSYAEGLEICKQGQDAIKSVIVAAEPERMRLQKAKDELLAQRDKIIGAITTAIDPLERATRSFNLAEKEAARKEQDRINEDARKAAEKANKGKPAAKRIEPAYVEVKPNIPSVPGIRVVPHYRFTVVDPSKVSREFWCIDEKAINAKLRKDDNPAKSEKEIGGIKVRIE